MKPISTDAAPKPVAAYSQATVAGGFVFTAGQVGVDPVSGTLVDGLTAQAERAFSNVRTILAAGGCAVEDVVKVTIFLTDMTKFAEVNKVYEAFVGNARPARTTVGVSALPLGALIEIDAIAAI